MNNLNMYCVLLVVSQPTLILLVRDWLTLRRHSTKIKTNNSRETYSCLLLQNMTRTQL